MPTYVATQPSDYYSTPRSDGEPPDRTTTGASASPRSDATRDVSEPDEGRESKKSEHFRIGVLGGVGFPRPLAVEGLFKVERAIAIGAEYSVLPTLTVSGVETTFHALAADVRIFPLQGPFFLGLRAGHQHLGGSGTVTVNGHGMAEDVTVDTTFVNPRLGFLWTFEPGFSIGIDAGVQIPVTSNTSTSLPSGTVANQQALSIANAFGSSVIPTIDLLRLGFLI